MLTLSLESKSVYYSSAEALECIAEDTTFYNHGYEKINKICDALQGELYKAKQRDNQKYVCIKKTSKYLCHEQIASENGNRGTYFCVSENILKESLILKHLTVENQPIGDYIVQYVDFFATDNDYYLVMEYIESETNLKQFISQSKKHITNGKLSMQEYRKMSKYILWQLFVTVQWLHNSMHCAHLDLCMSNIMLQNASFIDSNTKDKVHINPTISIKLCDFGVAEMFQYTDSDNEMNIFKCEKQGLNIFNECYFAPNVFNGDIYNAVSADNWSLGIILFQCMTVGSQLYLPLNMYNPSSGYMALFQNTLAHYLCVNNLLQYFNVDSYKLLNSLLNVNEEKRLKGINILRHQWFALYFQRYKKQIFKKIHHQKQKLMNQQQKLKTFPFYC